MSFDLGVGRRPTLLFVFIGVCFYGAYILKGHYKIRPWYYDQIDGFQRHITSPYPIPHGCTFGKKRVFPFTQGLLFTDDTTVLESSGLTGQSFLREFDVNTGVTKRLVEIEKAYFAEGCAIVIEPSTLRVCVMVLTYTDNVVLVYDYATLTLIQTYPLKYTGFGLVSNYDFRNKDLASFIIYQKVWMTTSEDKLVSLVIPDTFGYGAIQIGSSVNITLNDKPLPHLNELEYRPTSRTVYANIWPTNYIVEMDPWSGICLNVWDLSNLVAMEPDNVDVLNGIACHPSRDDCIVTGKYWRRVYTVKFLKNGRILSAVAGMVPNKVQKLKALIQH